MEYGLQMELPSNILGTIVRPCLQIVPLSSNGVIIGARMVIVTGGMTLQERQLRFDKITMISKDAFQLDSKVAFAKGGGGGVPALSFCNKFGGPSIDQ